MVELFGRRLDPLSYVPVGIDILLDRLPQEYGLTVERLLQRYTLFPYINPFAFGIAGGNLLAAVSRDQRNSISRNTFVRPGDAELPWSEPRYCPACVREDWTKYGLPYWHRKHQIPDVTVCTLHGVRLRASCPTCGPKPWVMNTLCAPGICRFCGQALDNIDGQFAGVSKDDPRYRLALLIGDIVDADLPRFDLGVLRSTYREGLARHGLLFAYQIRQTEFRETIIKRFGRPYLISVGANLSEETSSNLHWSSKLFADRIPHTRPILYCLLVDMLFDSFADFLKTYRAQSCEPTYSIDGSVPILREARRRHHPKIGFKYVDPLSPIVIAAILADLASGEPAKAIEAKYGAGKVKIDVLLSTYPDIAASRKAKRYERLRAKHRSILLKAKKDRPGLSQRTFRHFKPTSFTWLTRNDRDWLAEVFGPESLDAEVRPYTSQRLEQRDAQLADAIMRIATNLRNASDRCQRVTKTGLARLTGSDGLRSGRLSAKKYPRTLGALRAVVETPMAFMERKMQFLVRREHQSGHALDEDKLLALCGIARVKWGAFRPVAAMVLRRNAPERLSA